MTRKDLIGLEFDWFALDKNNDIALFSSAGWGNIPDTVMQNYEEHKNISEFLIPNYGLPVEVYANYGLFVYDWKISQFS